MQGPGGAWLGSGRRALERADWESARSAFAAALTDGEADGVPDARDGLAQAQWFHAEPAS